MSLTTREEQSESTQKNFGMTSAISLAQPKPEEIKKTEELLNTLKLLNIFEGEKEVNQRIMILSKLNILFKQWIRDVSLSKNFPLQVAENLGGKVYAFGSHRLGVHYKGSDVDALCIAPKNIHRFDYFKTFFELLKTQPGVSNVRAIEEAFVPLIKINFDGIEIDLLFARLLLREIPDNLDLKDNNLLRNMDIKSVRSVNGYRVADEILDLVPNIENFKLALRAIKFWAKSKAIYKNSLGYFGGVSWAILVARTCQLYPNAAAGTLIQKFFLLYSTWAWPKPVLLKRPEDINLGFRAWDSRINYSDKCGLMPIITPAYPSQSSTFNVSESTRNIIMKEIKKGLIVTEQIMLGRATWNYLFEPSPFFSKYKCFIGLLVSANNAKDHLKWNAFVESKIRFLIARLERVSYISSVHVYPKSFELSQHKIMLNNIFSTNLVTNNKQSSNCSMWFVGLEFEDLDKLQEYLTPNIQKFTVQVKNHGVNINLLEEGMSIEARLVKRKHLNQYLDLSILKSDKESMDRENHFNNALIADIKRFSSSSTFYKRNRDNEFAEQNSDASYKVKKLKHKYQPIVW